MNRIVEDRRLGDTRRFAVFDRDGATYRALAIAVGQSSVFRFSTSISDAASWLEEKANFPLQAKTSIVVVDSLEATAIAFDAILALLNNRVERVIVITDLDIVRFFTLAEPEERVALKRLLQSGSLKIVKQFDVTMVL